MQLSCNSHEYIDKSRGANSFSEKEWIFLLEEKNESNFLFPFWRYLESLNNKLYLYLNHLNHIISLRSHRLIIVSNIKNGVLDLVKRTVVWEFNLCCKKDRNITLNKFLMNLASEIELNKFFKKYPVLKMIFLNLINNHQSYLLNLFDRMKSDLLDIEHIFKLNNFNIISYESLGDAHCSGNRVTAIIFRKVDGRDIKKIIYKPRSVDLEEKFNGFINFIKKLNSDLDIKIITIINKIQYGWLEYIHQKPTEPPFEAIYYYKLGLLLGICSTLNAQDLHFENLIASGIDPVIVDLECLFSPPITKKQEENIYFPTIFDTLLIPFNNKSAEGVYDFSALLNHGNQKSFVKVFNVAGDFSRHVYIERKTGKIEPLKNILKNSKTNVIYSPSNYSSNITAGFVAILTFLIENKKKIKTYIVNNFLNLENRIIIRPTFLYYKLQLESYHPSLLSNIDKYLSFLYQLVSVNNNACSGCICEDELIDLINGDIPYFYTTTNGISVKNSRRANTLYACLDSGFNRVIKKLDLLNQDYIDNSVNQIEFSLRDRYV